MTTEIKASEIYRRAAIRTWKEQNTYSCSAIADTAVAMGASYLGPLQEYSALFRPHVRLLWGNAWGDKDERRECRILALLFMAAIAEDEENGK